MNRFKIFSLAILAVLVVTGVAMAAGNYPWTKNKQLAPNVTAIAPEKGQSGCVTTAATKGAIQGKYSSMDGYVRYDAEVFTIYSSSATQPANPKPAMVMWEVDGVMMAVGHNISLTNNGSNTYKRAVQRAYSTPKKPTYTSCTRRQ